MMERLKTFVFSKSLTSDIHSDEVAPTGFEPVLPG